MFSEVVEESTQLVPLLTAFMLLAADRAANNVLPDVRSLVNFTLRQWRQLLFLKLFGSLLRLGLQLRFRELLLLFALGFLVKFFAFVKALGEVV